MTAGTKDKTWTDGNILYAAELNSYILQPLTNLDATDNTLQSASSSNAAGETVAYATKRTVTIAANQVNTYVIISGDLEAENNAGSGANPVPTMSAYLQITINGTQKIELIESCGTGSSTSAQNSKTRGFEYKYTPSAGEKSAGFTINLDLKVVRGASAGNSGTVSAINNYWKVIGA